MLIIPGPAPLQETRHSRELGRRVEQVVRDYQREHPEMTASEVRAALMHSAPGDSPDVARRKRILGVAIAAAVAAGFGAMAATGGGRYAATTPGWQIVGAVAAVAAVAITVIRIARRA
jgi:hypothetical protein